MSGRNHEGSRLEDVSQNHTGLHLPLMCGLAREVYAVDHRKFGLGIASTVVLGLQVSRKVTWSQTDVEAEPPSSFRRHLEDRGAIRYRSPVIPIFGRCYGMFHTTHRQLFTDCQTIWDLW